MTKIQFCFHKMANARVNYIAKVRSGTIFVDGPLEEVKEEIAIFFFLVLDMRLSET